MSEEILKTFNINISFFVTFTDKMLKLRISITCSKIREVNYEFIHGNQEDLSIDQLICKLPLTSNF